MNDEHWMRLALVEARLAAEQGEIPVGAVIVLPQPTAGNRPQAQAPQLEMPAAYGLPPGLVGRGHNQTESLHDPTAHAEIIAISAAANTMNNWRLTGATAYVTIEPCLMCTGALILARVQRVVFGVKDARFGACGSVYDIPWDSRFNHRFEVTSGVLAPECQEILSRFFARQRKKRRKGAVSAAVGN